MVLRHIICILHVCPPPEVRSPSITVYLTPFTLHCPRPSFSSGNQQTVVCVYESLFVCLVCSFVAFSFTSHIWVKLSVFYFFWLISLSMIFSRSIHGSFSSFLMAEQNSIIYMHHIFIQSSIKGYFCVSMSLQVVHYLIPAYFHHPKKKHCTC